MPIEPFDLDCGPLCDLITKVDVSDANKDDMVGWIGEERRVDKKNK